MTQLVSPEIELAVIATFTATPGKVDSLRRELDTLVACSRRDDGCIAFDRFEDIENDGVLVLVERWATEGQWRAHLETLHVKAFVDLMIDLVRSSAMHALR